MTKVGEQNGRAILTEKNVIDIRKKRAEGRTIYSLAKETGMSQNAISAIVHRRTWKHVE